jgi:class 3 adenylate cyclase
LTLPVFTAWSSEREPSQVFTLLENLYHAFDEVGRKLGVFKVETIGDSYVAVAGLPTPRKDHAVGTYDIANSTLTPL